MSNIDYSKWSHIDISDDEDNQHPNIDKASLWKWEKESRYARYAEEEKKKTELIQQKQRAKALLIEAENEKKDSITSEEKEKLLEQYQDFEKKEAEILRKEKLFPNWNSSNMCKDGFNSTRVNKNAMKPDEEKTDEEIQKEQSNFFKKYKLEIRKYGKLTGMEAAKNYLLEHPHLLNEYTANYLVVWCVDLQVEEKDDEVLVAAKQTVIMQHLLEIKKTNKHSTMDIIRNFFKRTKEAGDQYTKAFEDEYKALVGRVQNRAKEREEEAIAEYEAKEKEKRIAASPGGMDPNEVMESLPASMRNAFEARDIPALQEAVKEMDIEEAKYHIDRCVKSGLWVAGGDDEEQENDVPEEYDEPTEE